MIKAVLVDDERPALRMLEHLLQAYPEISIAGVYTNPLKAIDDIRQIQPQVVFLDINMPQLMGIDAASKILGASPDSDIVFVTAYDRYAVEAFELNALDYLLKPVEPDRLEKTVERLTKKKPVTRDDTGRRLQIRCLGQFQIVWEGKEPIKWRAEKTRELFAFLLYHQGRDISKEVFLDRLWPDDEPEKAIRQLYNGIYYIRKALASYGVDRNLICIDSNYNLTLGPVDWDVGRLCELEKSRKSESLDGLEEMEALYTGEYLEGEYYPWASFERERLAKLYHRYLTTLSRLYMEKRQYAKAESKLERAYLQDPYEEITTELLLQLYRETGEKGKAVRHFARHAKLLHDELGIMPSGKILQLVRAIS